MTMITRFIRAGNVLSLLTVAMLLCTSLPVMAQQTVDPVVGSTCYTDSTERALNAQTGTFTCVGTPGSATGTWRKTGQTGMRVAYAMYSFATDGGAISTITPAINTTIPANAIIVGVIANPTTALLGASATIAIGTSAGSSTTALKAATAVASYSIDALMPGVPVFTAGTAVKMSAAGSITITVATTALTAGVLEIFVFYVVPTNA